jgi:hypothetical protein
MNLSGLAVNGRRTDGSARPIRLASSRASSMKFQQYQCVRLVVDVKDDDSDDLIPAGTTGAVVECFATPAEGYAVDLDVPDATREHGFRWYNVILGPEALEPREP